MLLRVANPVQRLGHDLVPWTSRSRRRFDERLPALLDANDSGKREFGEDGPAHGEVVEAGPVVHGALAVTQDQEQKLFVQMKVVAGG